MASSQVFQDQENSNAQRRFAKENSGANQQQKRAVLGILNSNVLRPLQQKPLKKNEQKFVKQKPVVEAPCESGNNQENLKILKQKSDTESKKDTFKIYDESANENVQNDCKAQSPHDALPETITSLHRLPLHDICEEIDPLFEDSYEPSPMVVDKTPSEVEIKNTSVKEIKDDYLGMEEYKEDIYGYLREAETLCRPKPNYMKRQTDITYSMRSILVDWLVEVAEEYKLHTETLYQAVAYIDRFLSCMSVVRAKLQLVGTAAMFIAAKYEEIYPPDVGEFVYITDDTYTKKQVLRMEHLILKVLGFDISSPTIHTFLIIYTSEIEDMKDTAAFLAMYISELSLLEGDPFLEFLPSVRAASAVALARHTLSLEVWPQHLQDISGYKLSDLETCIGHLHKTFEGASTYPQQAVREKYKSSRWNNVSLLVPRATSIC